MPRMEQLPGFEFELSAEYEHDRARAIIMGSYAITSLAGLMERMAHDNIQTFLETTQPGTLTEPFSSHEDVRINAYQEAKAAQSLCKLSSLWLGQDGALEQSHRLDHDNEFLASFRHFAHETGLYELEDETPSDAVITNAMHLMDLQKAHAKSDQSEMERILKSIPQGQYFSPLYQRGLLSMRRLRQQRGNMTVQVLDRDTLVAYLDEMSRDRAPDGVSSDGADIHTITLEEEVFELFCEDVKMPFYKALMEGESYKHIHLALLEDMRSLNDELRT